MPVHVVQRDDQYILNHCTRFLAREITELRHNFGQFEPDDARGRICEAWRFPIVDSHWDGFSAESSYGFNDVTFVYDGRSDSVPAVGVIGSFGPLYEATPLRPVNFLGESTGYFAVTVRVPKQQIHTYKFLVGDAPVVDPVNPQRVELDNGEVWSRFFTDACHIPVVLTRKERDLLHRVTSHLLPFRLEENRRFIRDVYEKLDRAQREEEFPLAYRLDEEVGVVNHIDKVLAREEQHNLDDYRTCLAIIDSLLRRRYPRSEPARLPLDAFVALNGEMATNAVEGWDTARYASPRHFLFLLRRHAMTGAFVHPKHGGNSGGAGWDYLEERFRDPSGGTLFDWRRAVEAPLGRNRDYRG